MRSILLRRWVSGAAGLVLLSFFCNSSTEALADEVQMRNGDRYVGKVLSLNGEVLVIQNDNVGTLRLPRAKVAMVSVGSGSVAPANPLAASARSNSPAISPRAATNSVELASTLRQSPGTSNLVEQVQAQYLAGAGPEATAKFNELLGGYLSGRLTVNDIRAQARSAADQIRSVRKDLDEDTGGMVDGYLAILDRFLKETGSGNLPSTTGSSAATPGKGLEDE